MAPLPAAQAEATRVARLDDGRRTLARLPVNLGRGALGVFGLDNLGALTVGAVVAGGASNFDQQVREAAADPGSSFGKGLSSAGGVPAAVTVAGLFVGGRFAQGPRLRAMSYDLLDATLVNGAYTGALKRATHRERPDGSNDQSFPSGHTSNAFTFATVVERHYGWKLGGPAYVLAGAIGYARIVQDVHYLSDVLAGATLGYVVGRTVVRVNGRPLDPGRHASLSLAPIATRRARGLQLRLAF